MKFIKSIILLILSITAFAQAQDQSGINEIKFTCKIDTEEDSNYFLEIQDFARKLNQDICDDILVPTRKSITEDFPRDRFAAFGIFVKGKVNAKFGKIKIPNLAKQLDHFETILTTGKLYPEVMPVFRLNKGAAGPRDRFFNLFFTDYPDSGGILTIKADSICLDDASLKSLCSIVLEDLAKAIYPYQLNANAFTAYETRKKLTALARDWDSYFEDARSQTFVDIVITTSLEKNHFNKDYLVGPPKRQWFLFHPNVLLENVEAAPDGENTKAALSIEWIGVNYWKNFILGIPFGVSLISLYSDRAGIEDVGHGVTLYFYNKYALGFSNHGGSNGFYLSTDLLKMFENETKQADYYRDRIKK